MDIKDQLRQNAETNFSRFKSELQQSTTETVFDSAYKIYAYGLLCDLLGESDDLMPFEYMDFLLAKNDTVIDFLWERLSNTVYFAGSYDELSQMTKELYEENLNSINLKEQLKLIAEANFQRFQEDKLKKPPQDIFNNAYQIHFYNELHEIFTSDGFEFDDKIYEFLCEGGETIIDTLYSEYINDEFASIQTWGDIAEFIDYCFEKTERDKEIEM